jgi:hypothetical protein
MTVIKKEIEGALHEKIGMQEVIWRKLRNIRSGVWKENNKIVVTKTKKSCQYVLSQ